MMDEKKVREAIEDLKNLAELFQNKESPAVEHCNIAIEALEKQLPKKPVVINNTLYNNYRCPRCGDYIVLGEPFCLRCEQQIDWSR